jgi:hypothetical protein
MRRYSESGNGRAMYRKVVTEALCCCCAGTLNVMDIFNGRDSFKMHVQEKVEKVRGLPARPCTIFAFMQ